MYEGAQVEMEGRQQVQNAAAHYPTANLEYLLLEPDSHLYTRDMPPTQVHILFYFCDFSAFLLIVDSYIYMYIYIGLCLDVNEIKLLLVVIVTSMIDD